MTDTQLTIDGDGNVTGGNLQAWEAMIEVEELNLDGFDKDYFEICLDENDNPLAVIYYQQGPARPPAGGQSGSPGGVSVTGGVGGSLNWRSSGTTTVVTNRDGGGQLTGTTTTSTHSFDRGASVNVNLNATAGLNGLVKKVVQFFRRPPQQQTAN